MPGSISSSQSSKPDYTASSFRGALMCDHCADGDAEFSMVNSFHIAEIGRASYAIKTIARLVHNSLSEPSMSSAEPLGESAHLGLLCAAEIIGNYLGDIGDAMLSCARRHAEFANTDGEGNHG
ncbi:hypothetical protein [Caballeronia sp. dw_19]|uniref:hypothetical protein n=1 Tax=Caballeronia sp. dw_19 TaxID=2719791 RepID=UPI001BD31BD1|nr:hypothetical protein [Caballeronia sp. dw_19]